MVYRVHVLVRNPDPVFDWVSTNIPADALVRQKARGVNYENMKAGAIVATCPADDPDFGWLVQIVVKSREAADSIVSAWSARAGLCEMGPVGA
jgi:hypothetical protein